MNTFITPRPRPGRACDPAAAFAALRGTGAVVRADDLRELLGVEAEQLAPDLAVIADPPGTLDCWLPAPDPHDTRTVLATCERWLARLARARIRAWGMPIDPRTGRAASRGTVLWRRRVERDRDTWVAVSEGRLYAAQYWADGDGLHALPPGPAADPGAQAAIRRLAASAAAGLPEIPQERLVHARLEAGATVGRDELREAAPALTERLDRAPRHALVRVAKEQLLVTQHAASLSADQLCTIIAAGIFVRASEPQDAQTGRGTKLIGAVPGGGTLSPVAVRVTFRGDIEWIDPISKGART